MPASPILTKAGVTWLSLQWRKPSGTPSDEGISYILEMEDETSVSMNMYFKTFQCGINPNTVHIATIVRSFPKSFESLVCYILEVLGVRDNSVFIFLDV